MSVQSEINRIKAGKEDIRAAITEKGQSVPATAPLSSYGDKIRAIQTGVDTSDATAAAGDILTGKTAYVKGARVSGAMAKVTQAAPSISVSSGGLITASATQAAGYVAAGTKASSYQLPTQGARTITPGAADQAIAAGYYLTGAQTIQGDANLLPENIREGISIFGVEGSHKGGGGTAALSIESKSSNVQVESVRVFRDGGFVKGLPGSTTGAGEYSTEGCALVTASISGGTGGLINKKYIAIHVAGGVPVEYTPLAGSATQMGTSTQSWIIQPTSDRVTVSLADSDSVV